MTLSPDFLFELKKRFTGDLRLDPASRALYSTDASMYQIEPLGVAIPKTQDDLQAAPDRIGHKVERARDDVERFAERLPDEPRRLAHRASQ